MSAYEEFSENLLDLHLELFSSLLNDGSVSFGKRPREEPMSIREPTRRDERFLYRLFQQFVEIKESFDRLKDTEIYIRQYPFRTKKLDKVRYLRHVIEGYLNEIYVLQARLETLAKFVQRAYRHNPRGAAIAKVIDHLVESVRTALAAIVEARGRHVHEDRFTDLEIRQLAMLKIIVWRKPELKPNFDSAYLYFRRRKTEWVHQNNIAVLSLLDHFFDALSRIVLTTSKRLRPPGAA